MGSVWRAEHLAWQAPVAIKVMTRDVADHPDALARFEREVQLAAGLRSPHVVQVLDHGIDAATQTPFIAMELLEGESLARRLKRAGRLHPSETFQIVSQLVRALSRAHAAGIVHRDLKPDNVFLVRNEEETIAKVLDFGVAKWTTPSVPKAGLTRPGSVLGTPFYMSPEQIQGSREIDHRADLWSLAAIACECLTGRRPFEAPDFAQLAVLLLTSHGRPLPSQLGPVPPGFDAWFQRATAPNIEHRFQSAREMAQSLAPICGAAAALAPDSTPLGSDSSDSREFPSMAAVSHTASRFFPGQLWRRPLTRVALSALAGLIITGAVIAVWLERTSFAPNRSESVPLSLSPAPRAAGALEPSPAPSVKAAPAPTPSAPSAPKAGGPGIRVVNEPIEMVPATSAPADEAQSHAIEDDSSLVVSNPKDGVEVDQAGKIGKTQRAASSSNDKRSGARPKNSKRSTGKKPGPPAAAGQSPASATGDDTAPSLDVNGRRVRTTL